MNNQVPVACSLSGGEAAIRAAELADLGDRALKGVKLEGSAATLLFESSVRDEIGAVIAAESKCCPFFEFEVSDARDGLILHVSAHADAAPAVAELVATFQSKGAGA